jgi:RNA polymerase sigma factor (sigma-70 family)
LIAPPPTVSTAEDLLLEFERTGDPAAFEEVVRRYTGMVYGVCYRVTRNAHDAEDAAQAVFLKLATQTRSGDGVPRVGPWLQQVARTTAVDLRRSRTRRTNREQVKAALTEQQASHADATEDVGMDELKQLLRDEVDQLPPHYRTPLILYYFGGLSTEQIARELKSNAKALAVRLFRGRKMLGARLSARGVAAGSAVGGGAVLSLAVVDAILAAMANASFAAPGGSAAVYGTASAGTAMGGSAAWATSHAAIFASIVERVSAVTRACAVVSLAGKWKLSGLLLLMVGSAMAATSDAVQQHPAVQRVADLLGNVRSLLNGGNSLNPMMQGPGPQLRVEATPRPGDGILPPTVSGPLMPPVVGVQPSIEPPVIPPVRVIGVPPSLERPSAVALDLPRRSVPQSVSPAGSGSVSTGGAWTSESTHASSMPQTPAGQAIAALGSAPDRRNPAALDVPGAAAPSAAGGGDESLAASARARLFSGDSAVPPVGPVASAADLREQAARSALAPSEQASGDQTFGVGLAGKNSPIDGSEVASAGTAGGMETAGTSTEWDGRIDPWLSGAVTDGVIDPALPTIDMTSGVSKPDYGFGSAGMIPAPSANPIPEPAGLMAIALGAAGLLARRRRRG